MTSEPGEESIFLIFLFLLPFSSKCGLRVSTNATMAWSTVIICAAHRLGKTKESERKMTSGEKRGEKAAG